MSCLVTAVLEFTECFNGTMSAEEHGENQIKFNVSEIDTYQY